jgi:hypothetical protein
LIRQHIFAGTDRGLFRQDGGADTVARSRGLSDQFITSVLHAYCAYEPPFKLSGYLEENRDQYPVSLIAFWADSGELVLGRTLFKPGYPASPKRPGAPGAPGAGGNGMGTGTGGTGGAGASGAGAGGRGAGGNGTNAGGNGAGTGTGAGAGGAGGNGTNATNAGAGGAGATGPGGAGTGTGAGAAGAGGTAAPGGSASGDSFLTHQLVLLPSKAAELVPDMMNLLYVTDFRSGYENQHDTNLPELASLHFDAEGCRLDNGDLALLKYGVNESVFGAMLAALMSAIREGKSVYVVPNVKTGKLYETARCILKFLIAALPYSYRKKLGFATYVRTGVSLPRVNLYFLERDYASYTARGGLGEYVFDFANNDLWKPAKSESDLSAPIYLSAAWQYRKSAKKAFFDFTAAAAGQAPANIDTLNALAAFWLISDGQNMDVYKDHRQFVMTALAQSATKKSAVLAPRIKDVFARIMEQEQADTGARQGYLTAPPVMSQIALYAENAKDNGIDEQTVSFCADSVAAARGADRIDYIDELFSLLNARPRIFKKLQARLNETMGGALDGVLFHYAMKRLEAATTPAKLVDEIEFWWANNPGVFKDAAIAGAFAGRAKKIFAATKDKAVEGAKMHTRMEYLLRNAGSSDDRRVIFDFVRGLLEAIDRIVLDSLTGDSITVESLQALKIDSDALKADDKYKALEALKGFVCSDSQYVMDKSLKALKAQGPHAYKRYCEIVRRLLAPLISSGNYDKIVAVFTDDDGEARFGDIFGYINENKNKGESCNFVKWAFRSEAFSGQDYSKFNNAVVDFFSQFSPKEFKLVFKNFAYLYANQGAGISDSEKNLKHILDVFRGRNSLISKPTITKDFKGIGTVAVVALSIVVGIVLLVTLVSMMAR